MDGAQFHFPWSCFAGGGLIQSAWKAEFFSKQKGHRAVALLAAFKLGR
jgi:hypothetical protein